jgi:predicted DNA-binding protein (MmcQ/YjbR family)
MNKKHWNTVAIDELGEATLLFEWIRHSYEQVLKGFPKKRQGATHAPFEDEG